MTKMHCSMLQAAGGQELLERFSDYFKQLKKQLEASAAATSNTLHQEMAKLQAAIQQLESLQMGEHLIEPSRAELKKLQEQAGVAAGEVQEGMQKAWDSVMQGLPKECPNLVAGGLTPNVSYALSTASKKTRAPLYTLLPAA